MSSGFYVKLEEYLNDLFKINYSLRNNLGQKALIIFQKKNSVRIIRFSHSLLSLYLALSLDSHLPNEENTLNCHRDYISISGPLTVIV